MDTVTKAMMAEFSVSNSLSALPASVQFEHFSAYCVLSARFPDEIETQDVVVGDGGDLNVDAFAVKINGRLIEDADEVDDILELHGRLEVEFIIVQAKSSESFDGAAILALGDNLAREVFAEQLTLPANDDIKRFREIKDRIYSNAAKLKENPVCRIFYVCTGNWKGDEYLTKIIERKREDLEDTNLFSEVTFDALGAKEVQKLFRQTKTSISRTVNIDNLVTLPPISGVEASYLGFLPASEFLKLMQDVDGDLMKSVFVDNVRDFQGENAVNKDIAKTIQDGHFDQFVLRNNGITIVAKNIRPTARQYLLEDYQIVNGCQTSHVLFENKEDISADLQVPIKLIHTEDEEVAQAIVRSTNKQTLVDENDLLAFTRFQHDLEDFYNASTGDLKLYYERRGKQYARTEGIEKGRITTKGIQLKSYASMFGELPNQAGRYQGTLLKSVKDEVFQDAHRPDPYYLSALANYRFEIAIRRLPIGQRDVRAFRFYLLLAFRYRFEPLSYPGPNHKKVVKYSSDLIAFLKDAETAKASFDECVIIVRKALAKLGLDLERDNAKSRPLVAEVKRAASKRKEAANEHP